MNNFKAYLKENVKWLAVILFLAALMAATMRLNEIPSREIGYGLLLCLSVTIITLCFDYRKYRNGLFRLNRLKKTITVTQDGLEPPESQYETLYQDCIRLLAQEKNALQNEMLNREQDLSEYYSMWVHQVKTPIFALKLLIDEDIGSYLDSDTSEADARILNERQKQLKLFQIEQYVDMALQYTRLGAQANDFVIKSVSLDEVIRRSIHKYARLFIHKKLRLTYTPQGVTAITDQKWLGFVIDQLLSNAAKYTKQGGVTIRTSVSTVQDAASVSISIEDTGIGICAEDLPRVCEKGYTGCNGHENSYSSGIGLYLCRVILDKLGATLRITSEMGRGTKAEILITTSILQ